MQVEIEKINKVILEGEEIQQLWLLVEKECKGANSVGKTTWDMYYKLRRWFEED